MRGMTHTLCATLTIHTTSHIIFVFLTSRVPLPTQVHLWEHVLNHALDTQTLTSLSHAHTRAHIHTFSKDASLALTRTHTHTHTHTHTCTNTRTMPLALTHSFCFFNLLDPPLFFYTSTTLTVKGVLAEVHCEHQRHKSAA